MFPRDESRWCQGDGKKEIISLGVLTTKVFATYFVLKSFSNITRDHLTNFSEDLQVVSKVQKLSNRSFENHIV